MEALELEPEQVVGSVTLPSTSSGGPPSKRLKGQGDLEVPLPDPEKSIQERPTDLNMGMPGGSGDVVPSNPARAAGDSPPNGPVNSSLGSLTGEALVDRGLEVLAGGSNFPARSRHTLGASSVTYGLILALAAAVTTIFSLHKERLPKVKGLRAMAYAHLACDVLEWPFHDAEGASKYGARLQTQAMTVGRTVAKAEAAAKKRSQSADLHTVLAAQYLGFERPSAAPELPAASSGDDSDRADASESESNTGSSSSIGSDGLDGLGRSREQRRESRRTDQLLAEAERAYAHVPLPIQRTPFDDMIDEEFDDLEEEVELAWKDGWNHGWNACCVKFRRFKRSRLSADDGYYTA